MLRSYLSLLVPALVLVACSPTSDQSRVMATYRGGEVTAAEYDSWLEHRGKQDNADNRNVMLESVAFTEVVSAQAVQNGLADDAEVRWAGEEYERNLLVRWLRREIGRQTSVSAEEVEEALEANRADLVKKPRVRLRNIFKRVPDGAGEKERQVVRDGMESLRRQLLDGADFAALAEAESDSQTSLGGGLIGWVEPGGLSPSVERIAFGLQPGQISEILEGRGGFTILLCEKSIEGRTMSEEEALQRITETLRRRRAEKNWSQLRAELLATAAPSIDVEVLTRENPDESSVVAEFAGRRLTVGEVEPLIQSGRTVGAHGKTHPAALENTIMDHIFHIQAAQRARELGYDREPRFDNHIRWRTAEILVTAELTRLVGLELMPLTEPEIRDFFESNRELFVVRPRFRLAVIMFELDGSTLPQRYAEAEAALESIKKGETSFESAARRHSMHSSANDGGNLGWLGMRRAAAFGPRFFRTLRRMQPGEISGLVQQDQNLWILQLLDIQERRAMSFEEARARAEQQLGNRRIKELQRTIEEQIVQRLEFKSK